MVVLVFPLVVLVFPPVVLVFPLVVLVCPLVVLVSPLVCPLVVLVFLHVVLVFLHVVLVCPLVVSVSPLVVLVALYALNSSEVAITLFADYSKAFDTIRYHILLKKLNELGFSSSFIHLINSYLSDRYQFVQIEDKKSTLAQVMCRVLQGSILGPLLFNLNVTNMPTFTSSTCLQFADDTTLYKRRKVKDISDCTNIIKNNAEHLKA